MKKRIKAFVDKFRTKETPEMQYQYQKNVIARMSDSKVASMFASAYKDCPDYASGRLREVVDPHRLETIAKAAAVILKIDYTQLQSRIPELAKPQPTFVECMIYNGHTGKMELTRLLWRDHDTTKS